MSSSEVTKASFTYFQYCIARLKDLLPYYLVCSTFNKENVKENFGSLMLIYFSQDGFLKNRDLITSLLLTVIVT